MIIATLYDSHESAPDFGEQGWHDFSAREIACSCCGEVLIHTESMDRLQALRTKMGRPLIVNSGYRCPAHNAALPGASPTSLHKLGRAFDISTKGPGWDSKQVTRLQGKAAVVGFNGIGVYRGGWMHLDTGPLRDWER
jgi:uncharacterized protein YcbK (DUF882 family)